MTEDLTSRHQLYHESSFYDWWRPDILIIAILIGVAYFYWTKRRLKQNPENITLGKHKMYMILALVTFYIGEGSPIAYLGHVQLFSAHMLQQSFLYLVMPPLVFMALPDWAWKNLLQTNWMRRWVKPMVHPVFGIFVFNGLFSIYHLPTIFDSASNSMILHYLYHGILLLTAFHMWFPVFCQDKAYSRMSDLVKLAYIAGNGIMLTPACACIIFANKVLYEAYLYSPVIVDWMSPFNDQQAGGTIMKIMQEIVYGLVLAYIFFSWYRRERIKEETVEEPALSEHRLGIQQLPTHS